MKTNIFSNEEIRLFALIAESFTDVKQNDIDEADWHSVVRLALHHSILPILYKPLSAAPLSDGDRALLKDITASFTAQFYKLLFCARDLLEKLISQGVPVVLLKGASAARFYPTPENRKSTDIDVLLANPYDRKKAREILRLAGAAPVEADYEANHHEVWATKEKFVLELHTILVEPFDDRGFNDYINKRYLLSEGDINFVNVMGSNIPTLKDDRQAFHLLLHMLMDFYRTGFGLKLLCDWVAFWNRNVEKDKIANFLSDVKTCRQEGFLSVVTSTCIRSLGLIGDGSFSLTVQKDKIYAGDILFCNFSDEELCSAFLKDVVDTEREGKPASSRMVAMRDTGFWALVKEYHHQTVLNFPHASKAVITLPVLYAITLIRFLKNNRTLRGGQSVSEVIKTANMRSKLVQKITRQ